MISINTNYLQLETLQGFEKREAENPNFNRIYGELRFLCNLSNSLSGKHDQLIIQAAADLARSIADAGCTTAAAVEKAEKTLASLQTEAKSFEFLCVAHAHIDMNWMWGYNETVSVTLSTMETMLDLLREYPSFTFSQSQASVYKIVEEFAPEMLKEIKERIKEGRWEILASTWVETDKNMPSGESLSRHILYTKKYFSEKFSINPGELVIDFEPDTFGHNGNVPEICASGGVKYYYNCRGRVGEEIACRWKSPSGAELLIYTEPFWYNADVDYNIAEYAPELSRLTMNKTLLKVYGVGDHGGGPTRRDINRFIEMNSWPLYPKFTFGKLKNYFEILEKSREKFHVLDNEINFLCDGCYTTQTRIKAGNRKSERLLSDAEFFAASAASWAEKKYPGELLGEAWRKVLFNHFHDIIPGSGVTETREYASALYQQVFAAAESVRTLSLEAIAAKINRQGLTGKNSRENPNLTVIEKSRGEGAGAGYGQFGRSAGIRRLYHVFNSLPYDREEVVSITVWDYEGDIKKAGFEDCDGKVLPVQQGESGNYWGHHFDTVLTSVFVPSCGYSTIILDNKPDYEPKTAFFNDMRVQSPDVFILENELVKAELSSLDGSIISFTDKKTGKDLAVPGGRFGIFRLAQEAQQKGVTGWQGTMSAWFIGRYKSIENLNHNIEIKPASQGKLRNAWQLSFSFGNNSTMNAVVSLDKGSRMLRYDLVCNWREFGSESGIPNLHFYLAQDCKPSYLFDIPFGIKERKAADMDLPGESFVLAKNNTGNVSLALFSMDKYGFRCLDDSLSLTLIRGSISPDLTPETGQHRISFAIAPVGNSDNNHALIRESLVYRRNMTVISGKSLALKNADARNSGEKTGSLEPRGSFLGLKGGILSSVKAVESGSSRAQDGKKLVFRIYEAEGKDTKAEISLAFAVVSAYISDVLEITHLKDCEIRGDGKIVSFDLQAYSVRTIVAEFK